MTRTLNAPKKATDIILSSNYSSCGRSSFVSYQTYKVMWYTSSNPTALQSSVSGDLALESIFLTTLRAQEWAQYGLNSCGLLQGWIEIALLHGSLADGLYRKRCFFIHPNAATALLERDGAQELSVCQWGFVILQRWPSKLKRRSLLINEDGWKKKGAIF